MRLNREKLLSLWELEDMPVCDAGMQMVEGFLVTCGEAIDRFREEGPEDRLAQTTESYMTMVDHGNLCDDCKKPRCRSLMERTIDQRRTSFLPSMRSPRTTKQAFRRVNNWNL
jgi:hypothetical protein